MTPKEIRHRIRDAKRREAWALHQLERLQVEDAILTAADELRREGFDIDPIAAVERLSLHAEMIDGEVRILPEMYSLDRFEAWR